MYAAIGKVLLKVDTNVKTETKSGILLPDKDAQDFYTHFSGEVVVLPPGVWDREVHGFGLGDKVVFKDTGHVFVELEGYEPNTIQPVNIDDILAVFEDDEGTGEDKAIDPIHATAGGYESVVPEMQSFHNKR